MAVSLCGGSRSPFNFENPCQRPGRGSAGHETTEGAGKAKSASSETKITAEQVSRLLLRASRRVSALMDIFKERIQRIPALVSRLENEIPRWAPVFSSDLQTLETDLAHLDDTLRRLLEALMTYIVHVNHVKLNELFWAGNNPEQTARRTRTLERNVTKLQANVLMPVACFISEIARTRSVQVDASAIQRLRRIRYVLPSCLTLGDMDAFRTLNYLQRDFLTYSSIFFKALHEADML
ncbi:hypothetical protein LSAT2_029417 [Lamellibrachia satsuma]|nr:hypothetical protein LSAT2_029417 [Lamellibrachia satsuma]